MANGFNLTDYCKLAKLILNNGHVRSPFRWADFSTLFKLALLRFTLSFFCFNGVGVFVFFVSMLNGGVLICWVLVQGGRNVSKFQFAVVRKFYRNGGAVKYKYGQIVSIWLLTETMPCVKMHSQ